MPQDVRPDIAESTEGWSAAERRLGRRCSGLVKRMFSRLRTQGTSADREVVFHRLNAKHPTTIEHGGRLRAVDAGREFLATGGTSVDAYKAWSKAERDAGRQHEVPNWNTIYRLFHSWPEFLETCRMDPQAATESLRLIAQPLGSSPAQIAMAWQAVEAWVAGTPGAPRGMDAYIRWASKINRRRRAEGKPPFPSKARYVERLCGVAWDEIVERFDAAGAERWRSHGLPQGAPLEISDDEIVRALRDAYDELGGPFTVTRYKAYLDDRPADAAWRPSATTVIRRGATWERYLRAHDVVPSEVVIKQPAEAQYSMRRYAERAAEVVALAVERHGIPKVTFPLWWEVQTNNECGPSPVAARQRDFGRGGLRCAVHNLLRDHPDLLPQGVTLEALERLREDRRA